MKQIEFSKWNPYLNPFDTLPVPFDPRDIAPHAFKWPRMITLPPLETLKKWDESLNLEKSTYD